MSDCISREAVLAIIEKRRHEWGNHSQEWKEAIADIKALPSVAPKKWTPVTGPLDDPTDGLVLVQFSGRIKMTTYEHALGVGEYDPGYGWYITELENYAENLGCVVEAYMPLPEPYVKEGAERNGKNENI